MIYEYVIPSTGNFLVDAFCSLGLFRLMLMTDPLIKVEYSLGRYELLRVRSLMKPGDFENGILENLNKLVKDERTKQRLRFRINTGKGRIPAFNVLEDLIKSMNTFSPSAFQPITKESSGKSKTFYLSILPVYGKGLEKYDRGMIDESAKTTCEVMASYMIGLAYYTISWEEIIAETRNRLHLALIPPPGRIVNEDYLFAITRVITLYFTEENCEYIHGLKRLPRLTLPLAVLARLDLAIMEFFHEFYPPEILIFDVESGIRGGETSRLYERYNTATVLEFFLGLGERMHYAKEYVSSLVNVHGMGRVQNTELQGLIESILLELSLAILNSDANGVIRALFDSVKLKDRVSHGMKPYANMIYLPIREVTGDMVSSL